MNKKVYWLIILLSVAVPVLVAFLLFYDGKTGFGSWVKVLPHLNAAFNSTTSVALILGLIFIRRKQVERHRLMMSISFLLGALFLLSYVTYHSSMPSTIFGDINGDKVLDEVERASLGGMRTVYVSLLLSHIILSVVVLPFVLFAFYYALTDKIEKHKRLVKYTWPIWFYVSVSGVLVYLMISPYYQ